MTETAAPKESDARRLIIERAGIDPSSVACVVFVPEDSLLPDPSWTVPVGVQTEVEGHGVVTASLSAEGRIVSNHPGTLTPVCWVMRPVRTARADAPQTVEEHLARRSAAEAAMAAAGIGGCLTAVPCGWLPIVEEVIAALTALGVSGVHLVAKEKYATLDLWLRDVETAVVPDDLDRDEVERYLEDLAEWAETASSGRCMVFGTPGEHATVDGWDMILSREALALGRRGLKARLCPTAA